MDDSIEDLKMYLVKFFHGGLFSDIFCHRRNETFRLHAQHSTFDFVFVCASSSSAQLPRFGVSESEERRTRVPVLLFVFVESIEYLFVDDVFDTDQAVQANASP